VLVFGGVRRAGEAQKPGGRRVGKRTARVHLGSWPLRTSAPAASHGRPQHLVQGVAQGVKSKRPLHSRCPEMALLYRTPRRCARQKSPSEQDIRVTLQSTQPAQAPRTTHSGQLFTGSEWSQMPKSRRRRHSNGVARNVAAPPLSRETQHFATFLTRWKKRVAILRRHLWRLSTGAAHSVWIVLSTVHRLGEIGLESLDLPIAPGRHEYEVSPRLAQLGPKRLDGLIRLGELGLERLDP